MSAAHIGCEHNDMALWGKFEGFGGQLTWTSVKIIIMFSLYHIIVIVFSLYHIIVIKPPRERKDNKY